VLIEGTQAGYSGYHMLVFWGVANKWEKLVSSGKEYRLAGINEEIPMMRNVVSGVIRVC